MCHNESRQQNLQVLLGGVAKAVPPSFFMRIMRLRFIQHGPHIKLGRGPVGPVFTKPIGFASVEFVRREP